MVVSEKKRQSRDQEIKREIALCLSNIRVPVGEWHSEARKLREMVTRHAHLDGAMREQLDLLALKVRQCREELALAGQALSHAAANDSRFLDKVRSLEHLAEEIAETAALWAQAAGRS
ncbi:hypothetical protein GCM10011321_17430 [Youhaiella tibetensis]|nr:hypothetical protein GCM10011321_17430 [Youhaiella tibetensis]